MWNNFLSKRQAQKLLEVGCFCRHGHLYIFPFVVPSVETVSDVFALSKYRWFPRQQVEGRAIVLYGLCLACLFIFPCRRHTASPANVFQFDERPRVSFVRRLFWSRKSLYVVSLTVTFHTLHVISASG